MSSPRLLLPLISAGILLGACTSTFTCDVAYSRCLDQCAESAGPTGPLCVDRCQQEESFCRARDYDGGYAAAERYLLQARAEAAAAEGAMSPRQETR